MMADSEVKLQMDNVINKLLPEALAKGLKKAGQLVENDAKRNCPVDDGVLRVSITHVVETDESSVSIGTNVFYAGIVHEGSGIYNPEGRKTAWIYTTPDGETYISHGQKPNKFLQNAIDENMDKITQQFENLLEG